MVRILNFVCVALSALACLFLYHVSEQTRVAGVELSHVNREIVTERNAMSVLQAEWARVADPARIQRLSQARTGTVDAPTVELASLSLLPHRGQIESLGDGPVRAASAIIPVKRGDARIHLASIHSGN